MNLTVTLNECSDEQLQALLDQVGARGRTSVYKPAIRGLIEQSNGKNVSGSFTWQDVNPDAAASKSVKSGDKSARDVVLAGLKHGAKTMKRAKDRVTFLRGTDDDSITVVIRASK